MFNRKSGFIHGKCLHVSLVLLFYHFAGGDLPWYHSFTFHYVPIHLERLGKNHIPPFPSRASVRPQAQDRRWELCYAMEHL